jgi:hypothetical protein
MPALSGANLVREWGRARGRDRLAVCRTRSRPPCALIGCSRQPVVLQPASRSLPDSPIVKIMRNTGNKHLSSSPGRAGCLPAGARHFPLVSQDSMQVTQPSSGKRWRFVAFRSINSRAQLISEQGRLERVLKAANRLRFMALRFSRTRFVFTNSDGRAHRILSVQGIQRCWNSQLKILAALFTLMLGYVLARAVYSCSFIWRL